MQYRAGAGRLRICSIALRWCNKMRRRAGDLGLSLAWVDRDGHAKRAFGEATKGPESHHPPIMALAPACLPFPLAAAPATAGVMLWLSGMRGSSQTSQVNQLQLLSMQKLFLLLRRRVPLLNCQTAAASIFRQQHWSTPTFPPCWPRFRRLHRPTRTVSYLAQSAP